MRSRRRRWPTSPFSCGGARAAMAARRWVGERVPELPTAGEAAERLEGSAVLSGLAEPD